MSTQLIAGRYQIDEQDLIGQGAMSQVFRGLDTITEIPVAIKVLKRELAVTNPVVLDRFALEGEALRRLNHPNIAKMIAAVEEAGQPYIVMEYIGGGTLREKLRAEGPLPISEVLRISLELVDALTRAHYLQIVHRDIKPSNIMLDADGTPRLTDFGIARVADRSPITETGVVLGTYAYLSPEACYGEEIDGRVDIWALGVVMFEMLTGELPFKGDSIGALVTAILTRPVPDIKALRPDTPDMLVQLILQMLGKAPDQRISSARLVGAQLEAMIRSLEHTRQEIAQTSRRLQDLREHPTNHLRTPPVTGLDQLPHHSMPFLGRTSELVELAEMLNDPRCRLLTLTGPGGIGKTRLAIQAARNHAPGFLHGVRFVALEHITSPERVITALAKALDFSFYQEGDPRQQVMDFLREKHILLVLDNFEHLVASADLVAEMLDRAPRVKVLVTSRERLNLQIEWICEVGGMDLPDEDTEGMDRYSAIRLFTEHARRVDPDFTVTDANRRTIVQICRVLEGMPLSIELAASWLRSLTPEALLREIDQNIDFLVTPLRDVPERHRSLRAVFDTSWSLLPHEEQRAFTALAIFQGAFARDIAHSITGASPHTILALVDKSLVRRTRSDRYEILPTLRQFARQKLEEDPQILSQLQVTYCEFYAGYLHERQSWLEGSRQKQALDEIAVEIDNIHQAWRWSGRLARAEDFDRSLDSLFYFEEMRNWYQPGYQTFALAIDGLLSAERGDILGRLKARQGVFAMHLGRYEEARRLLEEGLACAQRHDISIEIAFCQNQLGILAYMQGRFEDATVLLVEAECVARSIRARRPLAISLTHLGLLAHLRGDYQSARKLHEESVALCRELGERRDLAISLRHLGITAYGLGEYAQAKRLYRQSMDIDQELGNRAGVALALNGLGLVAYEQGEYQAAQDYYEGSLAIKSEIGDRRGRAYSLNNLGLVAHHMADYRAARGLLEESLAISRELGERRAEANILNNLGDVAYALENHDQARRYYLKSIDIKQHIGDKSGLAHTYNSLGRVFLDTGSYEEAAPILDQSLSIYRELSHQQGIAESTANLGHLHAVTGEHYHARCDYAESLEIAARIQAVPLVLDIMTAAAQLAYSAGEAEFAAELLGLPVEHEAAMARTLERAHTLLPFLKNKLGPESFEAALKRGASMTVPEAALITQDWLAAGS